MLIKNPPVKITDHLHMLGTNEYPLFLYHDGSEGTFFEGGVGAMGPLLEEQLKQLGIGKETLRQVVITHAHPDHVMAVPHFRSMSPGITVLASELAGKTLQVAKAVSFFQKIDEALTGSLLKAGRIREEHRPQPLSGDQIPVDRFLKEGDTIPVGGGVSFNVLETPGHSDCSLSFFEPGSRVAIISDVTGYYIPDDESWWPNYFTGYEANLRSMERIASLGAEILCLSHNGVIQGAGEVKACLEGAMAAAREYHRRIVEQAKAGSSVRQIAETLGTEVHQKVQLLPLDFFQKNCGLLVKQSLKHEGIEAAK